MQANWCQIQNEAVYMYLQSYGWWTGSCERICKEELTQERGMELGLNPEIRLSWPRSFLTKDVFPTESLRPTK
jgi:hypothetical protein